MTLKSTITCLIFAVFAFTANAQIVMIPEGEYNRMSPEEQAQARKDAAVALVEKERKREADPGYRSEQRIAEATNPERIVGTCQVSDHEIINLTAGMFAEGRPTPADTMVKCSQIRSYAKQDDTPMLHKLTGGSFTPSTDMDVLLIVQDTTGIAFERSLTLSKKESHDLSELLFELNSITPGSYVYTLYLNGEAVEQELIQIG